jgi:hypothetical protein
MYYLCVLLIQTKPIMKKTTKKNDVKFRTECTKLVLNENNVISINTEIRNGNYRIVGEKNSLDLYFSDNVGYPGYDCYCRFEKPNELTNNCKYNFHTLTENVDVAIEQFETFFNFVIQYIN